MQNSNVRLPTASEDDYLNDRSDSPLDEVRSSVFSYLNSASPIPSTAAGVHDAWIAYTNAHACYGKESIDPSKSKSYAFIWRSWTKYLASVLLVAPESMDGKSMMLATPIDVAKFIANGPTASKPDRSISKITQRRYFTVLLRVYAFCVSQAWLDASPVDAVAKQDRPAEENHEGQVLSAAQWSACTQRLALLTSNDYEIRDRAILMLLFKEGLRPEEIRGLRLQDFQPDITNVPTLAIRSIRGPEQERVIPLDPATATSIQEWKLVRRNMRVVKRTLDELQNDFSNQQLHALSDTLFVTEKKMEIGQVALLTLVRSHIEKACISASIEFPNRMGPQIVRNSRIVKWLNAGIDVQQVVKRAGLKNAKGLLHLLLACSEEVQDKIKPARRRDDVIYQSNILSK